jgi:hypothetical protein
MIFDALRRLVKHIEKFDGQLIIFGDKLPGGIYKAEIRNGINRKTSTLIKY